MFRKTLPPIGLAAGLFTAPSLAAQTAGDAATTVDPTAAIACVEPHGAAHPGGMDHAAHTSGDGAANHAGHAAHHATDSAAAGDTAFAALQERGRLAMGVDQYTSTHRFDILPDGGRIELQRDVDDPESVRTIREHLRAIAGAFARGDFCTPAFVHGRPVPGTAVLSARRDAITYTFRELPRGGELLIRTEDPVALEAIRAFMRFQRGDHRQGGVGHP